MGIGTNILFARDVKSGIFSENRFDVEGRPMIFICIFIFLILLAFIIRILPRWLLPDAVASDTFYHLFCAEQIRKNKFKIPKIFPRCLLYQEHTYPFGYHYFLALFNKKNRERIEKYTSAIFDAVQIVIFGIMLYYYMLARESYIFSYRWDFISYLFLFAFSPALLSVRTHVVTPRAYNGNARTFGQMFFLIFMGGIVLYKMTGNGLLLVLSLVSGSMIFISSKFSVQAIVFFAPFFLFFGEPIYLLCSIGGLLLAIIITKGNVLRTLKGQYDHSVFYKRHLASNYVDPYLVGWRRYIDNFKRAFHGRRKKLISWLFDESYWIHQLIAKHPLLIPLLVLSLFYSFSSYTSIERFLWVWILAGLMWYIFTSRKHLTFLGEAIRYMEYCVCPIILLTSNVMVNFNYAKVILFLLVVYSIIGTIAYQYLFYHYYKPVAETNRKNTKMHDYLNEHHKGKTLWPMTGNHWQFLYKTNSYVLTHAGNLRDEAKLIKAYNMAYSIYPFPNGKYLDEVIGIYGIEVIHAFKNSLRYLKESCGVVLENERFKVIFEDDSNILFSVMK